MRLKDQRTQAFIDRFYRDNGRCCAGCDNWRWHNSVVGECIESNLVAGSDRATFLGIKGMSADIESGHVMTNREYACNNFIDEA